MIRKLINAPMPLGLGVIMLFGIWLFVTLFIKVMNDVPGAVETLFVAFELAAVYSFGWLTIKIFTKPSEE
jgi:hypothetical protein